MPGSSWANRDESYSFTTEELRCFNGDRQQTCPKQMPTWHVLLLLLTKDYRSSSSFTTTLTHMGSHLLSSSSYFQVLAAHKVVMAIIAV